MFSSTVTGSKPVKATVLVPSKVKVPAPGPVASYWTVENDTLGNTLSVTSSSSLPAAPLNVIPPDGIGFPPPKSTISRLPPAWALNTSEYAPTGSEATRVAAW